MSLKAKIERLVKVHENHFLLPVISTTIDITENQNRDEFLLSKETYDLIILNSDSFDLSLLRRIWPHFRLKICADGGANRLYDLLETSEDKIAHLPDLVKGDLDSIRPDVSNFYRYIKLRFLFPSSRRKFF
jgi:hypothetical protein